MNSRIGKPLVVCATVLLSSTAGAQDGEVKAANPASDRTNFLGDRLRFKADLAVRLVDTAKTGSDNDAFESKPGCAIEGTELKGLGPATVAGKPAHLFVVDEPADKRKVERSQTSAAAGRFRCPKGSADIPSKGDVVAITQAQIDSLRPRRLGLTYGTLVVPYKYHVRGNKEFTGSASMGGYLGYRIQRTAIESQLVVFLGATTIQAPTTGADGKVTTNNLAGVSYGVGWLGTIKNDFQLGIVVGADRAGRSANYVNQGKPWIAVSLGFDFSN